MHNDLLVKQKQLHKNLLLRLKSFLLCARDCARDEWVRLAAPRTLTYLLTILP